MKNIILDYTFPSGGYMGWAKIAILEKEVEFYFTSYDTITATIELGLIEGPDDRDQNRVGYEKSAFSAIVREVLPWESRLQYQDNSDILKEFAGTEFANLIIRHLALQAPEVRAAIQAEALTEVLRNAPTDAVELDAVASHLQSRFPKEFFEAVDLVAISDYIKHAWYAAEQETLSQL